MRSNACPTRSRSSICSAERSVARTYRQLDDAHGQRRAHACRASGSARASASPCWSATAPSSSNFSSDRCAPAQSRCRSTPGSPPTRSTDIIARCRMRACARRSLGHRDALAIARALAAAATLLLDRRKRRLLCRSRARSHSRRPPSTPPAIADNTQAFQPYTSGSTGRPKGAIMTHRGMLWYVAYNQRYWPLRRERPRPRRAAAVSQERAARHGQADALCRRLLRAHAGIRAARLSRSSRQIQMHLFPRRRGGVHDVSSASRLSRSRSI